MKLTEQTIQLVAQAVIANAKVLSDLIASLSEKDQGRVAEVVNSTPVTGQMTTPVTTVPASEAPLPQPAQAAAIPTVMVTPVVQAAPVASNGMPPPPFPNVGAAPTVAAAPAPTVTAPVSSAGFEAAGITSMQKLIQYSMDSYRALGEVDGKQLPVIMQTKFGTNNINNLPKEQWPLFWEAIEAFKREKGK